MNNNLYLDHMGSTKNKLRIVVLLSKGEVLQYIKNNKK